MTPPRAATEGYRLGVTSGDSMFPLIGHRSEVAIAPIDPWTVRPGDIVAFRRDGREFIHRIIGVTGSQATLAFREKGDNQPFSSRVIPEELTGKAVWVSTGGRLRRLDVPPSRIRVRVLTALSRLEADLFDQMRSRGSPMLKVLPKIRRPTLRILRWAAWPLKLAAAPLLLSAYRTLGPEETATERLFLLDCFRHAAGGCGEPPGPPSGLDWLMLLREASWHGLVPLLARTQRGRMPPGLLPDILRLRAKMALTQASALETIREAGAALTAAGLPCLVLKGPAVAAALYPEPSDREYSDLDLLVRRADRDRALLVLAGLGYRPEATGAAVRLLSLGHFHLCLQPSRKNGLPLELHWAPVDRMNLLRINEEDLFTNSRKVLSAGVEIPIMAPEPLLLYLCLHMAKHGIFNRLGLNTRQAPEWFCRFSLGNRLAWFMDLQLFLETHGESLDWGRMEFLVNAWNAREEVVETIGVLDLLVPGSLAAKALERLGAPSAVALTRSRIPGLLDGERFRRGLERSMAMNRTLLFRPARLLFLARVLFPSPTRLRRFYHLDNSLAVLFFYPIHPIVMALRFFRSR